MKRILITCLVSLTPGLFAQQSPMAGNPVADFKGKIQRVQIAPGQGTPYIEVQTGATTAKVFLGSMRYLMEKDFNPKAGEEVSGKGYKVGDDFYAIQVELVGQNKSLRLRDDNGYPLWMGGGRAGQGRYRYGQKR